VFRCGYRVGATEVAQPAGNGSDCNNRKQKVESDARNGQAHDANNLSASKDLPAAAFVTGLIAGGDHRFRVERPCHPNPQVAVDARLDGTMHANLLWSKRSRGMRMFQPSLIQGLTRLWQRNQGPLML
jgi:hypothetical protein